MAEKIFTKGMVVKPPRENAPSFVKGSLAFNVADFVKFLEEHAKPDGWVNVDILESGNQAGKWYGALNAWTKDASKQEAPPAMRELTQDEIDSIPF